MSTPFHDVMLKLLLSLKVLTASHQLHKSLTGRSMVRVKSSAPLWSPLGIIFMCLLKQSAPGCFSIGLQVSVTSKFIVSDVIDISYFSYPLFSYFLFWCNFHALFFALSPLKLVLPSSEGFVTLRTSNWQLSLLTAK